MPWLRAAVRDCDILLDFARRANPDTVLLVGTVTDSSHAVVIGAHITVTNETTVSLAQLIAIPLAVSRSQDFLGLAPTRSVSPRTASPLLKLRMSSWRPGAARWWHSH
jgi:hypothetical protein